MRRTITGSLSEGDGGNGLLSKAEELMFPGQISESVWVWIDIELLAEDSVGLGVVGPASAICT